MTEHERLRTQVTMLIEGSAIILAHLNRTRITLFEVESFLSGIVRDLPPDKVKLVKQMQEHVLAVRAETKVAQKDD